MTPPKRAVELQQFLCALNWIRRNVLNFAQLIHPLQKLLLAATRVAKSCKKSALRRVLLSDIGWGTTYVESFQNIRDHVSNLIRLAHPKDDWLACLFPDASQDCWSAVFTQIPPADCDLPVAEQRHELLACISGTFQANSLRWAIIEKEGYPIIEGIFRLRHFLIRSTPIRIFTNHRNLMYIFNATNRSANLARHTADRLERWQLQIANIPYIIEHIEGEQNIWADLFTRWGAPCPINAQMKSLQAPVLVQPLSADFVWPSLDQIVAAQLSNLAEQSINKESSIIADEQEIKFNDTDGLWNTIANDRIWIPIQPGCNLALRIVVIGGYCHDLKILGIYVLFD